VRVQFQHAERAGASVSSRNRGSGNYGVEIPTLGYPRDSGSGASVQQTGCEGNHTRSSQKADSTLSRGQRR
jgi:hypothetical protein